MTETSSIEVLQYRELFEEAPVAYHEIDQEGIIRRVNRAECALLGVTESEMVGRPIWQFMAGEDRENGQAALARKLAGTQPLAPFRRVYVTGKGRYITVEIHDRIIRAHDGRAAGMRSTLLDVTDQVEAEDALRRSQQWLAAVLRSFVDPVFAVDALQQVKFMNPAAERLTGYREGEAQGRDLEEVLKLRALCSEVGADTLSEHFGAGVARVCSGRAMVISGTGEERLSRITTSPILTSDDSIMGWTLVVHSATDDPAA